METGRLETFADGVFAIAATLLIIDVTADGHGSQLGSALAHNWPQYAAYAISFLTIGVMWVNHHECLRLISKADRAFLFINIALLICVAFIPFPTRLVAEHIRDPGARDAALAYGCTMIAQAACWTLLWFYALRRNLIDPAADPRAVAGITRSYRADDRDLCRCDRARVLERLRGSGPLRGDHVRLRARELTLRKRGA